MMITFSYKRLQVQNLQEQWEHSALLPLIYGTHFHRNYDQQGMR